MAARVGPGTIFSGRQSLQQADIEDPTGPQKKSGGVGEDSTAIKVPSQTPYPTLPIAKVSEVAPK